MTQLLAAAKASPILITPTFYDTTTKPEKTGYPKDGNSGLLSATQTEKEFAVANSYPLIDLNSPLLIYQNLYQQSKCISEQGLLPA